MSPLHTPSPSVSPGPSGAQPADGPMSHIRDDSAAQLSIESHRICPGCGTELVDRGCKMRCTRCGFFLDCSDG